jgi:D-glycerate 3-kinase
MNSEPAGASVANLVEPALAGRLDAASRAPFVLGICGAQGSGKSTVAALFSQRLRAQGRNCALLSLDDLYLDGAHRRRLAETVHPLLRTRGVPGTHAPALGLALIEALGREGTVQLPRFDKARDEPGPGEPHEGPADVVLFEGWCVGARPQAPGDLAEPVNALERERDPDGVWRHYVNDQLAGPYRALFERIDMLVLLAAPGFDVVADWRIEQERKAGGPMGDDEVRAFVAYYQRLTEHVLRNGPAWADLTISLDADRRPVALRAEL